MQNEWGAWNNYHFACNFAKCTNRLYVSNILWIWFIFLVYYGITTAEFGVLPQYILITRTETCIFSSTLDASGSQRLENEWGGPIHCWLMEYWKSVGWSVPRMPCHSLHHHVSRSPTRRGERWISEAAGVAASATEWSIASTNCQKISREIVNDERSPQYLWRQTGRPPLDLRNVKVCQQCQCFFLENTRTAWVKKISPRRFSGNIFFNDWDF